MTILFRAVLSPCIGVCSLGDDGLCDGCHRTGAEIARWSQMNDDERLQLMETVLARARVAARVKPLTPARRRLPDLLAALHPLAKAAARAAAGTTPSSPTCCPDGRVLVEAAVLVGLVPAQTGHAGAADPSHRCTCATTRDRSSFPGGRIEPDDADAVAAAVRETCEEVGLPPAQVAPLGFLDPLATITGFRVLPVVATIDSDYVAHPGPERSRRSVRSAAGVPARPGQPGQPVAGTSRPRASGVGIQLSQDNASGASPPR